MDLPVSFGSILLNAIVPRSTACANASTAVPAYFDSIPNCLNASALPVIADISLSVVVSIVIEYCCDSPIAALIYLRTIS